MLDPTTKARMALGLQKVPCPSCKHGVQDWLDPYSPSYSHMWCELYRNGGRKAGSCIPNTYNHFEPRVEPNGKV